MIRSVGDMIEREADTCLLLVDIGVWALRNVISKYSDRVLNAGIYEDGLISIAAGMSMQSIIPTVYGISPFIVERALEQIKLDFAYQKVGGNFITTGASYDFSTLGYSHYCPEDLSILGSIPGVEFVAPGSPEEFSKLFKELHRDDKPTYFRCSDHCNSETFDVRFGKANVIREGKEGTVIAVSTTMDIVMEACKDKDVTILYYTTLLPFDRETLGAHYNNGKVMVVHPFLEGSLHYDIIKSFEGKMCSITEVGVKKDIFRNYGTKQDNDVYTGLTVENVRVKMEKMINEDT